jgi:hypothetical protein
MGSVESKGDEANQEKIRRYRSRADECRACAAEMHSRRRVSVSSELRNVTIFRSLQSQMDNVTTPPEPQCPGRSSGQCPIRLIKNRQLRPSSANLFSDWIGF